MKRILFMMAITLMTGPIIARAQSTDLPKYEVAPEFTTVTLSSGVTLPGVGGRFTFNLNKVVALEAAGYFFPGKCDFCDGEVTGHVTEGLFGVKVGKRFKKVGIFGKARPGFMSFSRGAGDIFPATGGGFTVSLSRRTAFAFDVGPVLEFYPSKKIVLRFDAGYTMLHYGSRRFSTVIQDASGALVPIQLTAPPLTRPSLQVIAGVGFRF
jgi:hypothetical protein